MRELELASALAGASPRRHLARGVELVELPRVSMARLQTLRGERDRALPRGETRLPLLPGGVLGSEPWILWRAPGEWLAYALATTPDRLAARLRERLAGLPLLFAEVGAGSAWCEISGPGALEVLARDGSLDLEGGALPPGSATHTGMAQLTVLVHRLDAGERFRLAVDRSAARYFWDWLVDSAALVGAEGGDRW